MDNILRRGEANAIGEAGEGLFGPTAEKSEECREKRHSLIRVRLFLVFLGAESGFATFCAKRRKGIANLLLALPPYMDREGDTDSREKMEVGATKRPKGDFEFVKANTSAPG